MTTENKAEAEKIAREIISQWNYKGWNRHSVKLLQEDLTQALLDFREKDVRELVEALEPLASIPPPQSLSDKAEFTYITTVTVGHLRKAAALVRKFKEGKEG